MDNKGYIYLMINPAIPNMVKIGKTTREPEQRAKELSSSTGVPIEFVLVHKRLVNNCTIAEKYIHEVLESKGVRVSKKREFFEIPIYEAIQVIEQYEDKEDSKNEASSSKLYAMNILEEAKSYYYGHGDFLEDKYQALKLFKKSIDLGCSEGYLFIGRMYLYEEIDNKSNVREALKYFSEGSFKGKNECFAEMGCIYLDTYSENYNLDNGLKCWKKYFSNIDIEYIKKDDIDYFTRYLELIRKHNIPLEEKEILSFSKNRMIEYLIERLNGWQNESDSRYREYFIDKIEKNIEYIHINLKEPKDTIYAEYLNKLNIIIYDLFEVSNKPCISCKVMSGYINRYDSVIIRNKYGKKSVKILLIENLGKVIDSAEAGMKVGLLLDGDIKDFSFIELEHGILKSERAIITS